MTESHRDLSPSIGASPASVTARPSIIERPVSTKRPLYMGPYGDSARHERSKRPRIRSPTPPISRGASTTQGGRSHRRAPPFPRTRNNTPPPPVEAEIPWAAFGDGVDTTHGPQVCPDTTAPSCTARAITLLKGLLSRLLPSVSAPSATPVNFAGPPRAGQHFFEGASNVTIGSFNSYASSAGDQEVRLLVQLLQANLAQRGISQPVGYTRENGVRIVDALGRELVLPPSIMRQYSDVHELMRKHFRGKIGEERVIESRYCIVTEHDGTLVQPEDWDRILNSGEGLVMCMTVKKVLVKSLKDTCPQCGRTRLGTYRDEGWLICRRCEKRFKSSTNCTPETRDGPPIRDNEIASFRHVQKVFVKGPPLRRAWRAAECEEKTLFEGEVVNDRNS